MTMKLTMKLSLVVAILLVPATALAQSGTSTGSTAVELTPLSMAATLVSLVIGVLVQLKQNGEVFGKPLPGWAALVVGLAVPFFDGFGAYLGTASTLNESVVIFAIGKGLFDLATAMLPGFGVHAHLVVPAKMAALRAAKVSSAVTLPPAVGK
jgi:hypothetical protein